jgi:hypothetical protein
VIESCSGQCFLDPKNLKYPVCKKCSTGTCDCRLSCRGIRAAYQRAIQWKNEEVAAQAKRLEQRLILEDILCN